VIAIGCDGCDAWGRQGVIAIGCDGCDAWGHRAVIISNFIEVIHKKGVTLYYEAL